VSLGHPPDPRFPGALAAGPAAAAAALAASASASTSAPNFAQAALLLQNSSNVYGRKVEYLHALVYRALNDLVASTAGSRRGASAGASAGAGATEAILDELAERDAGMEFLLLDDFLPTDDSAGGGRINLGPGDGLTGPDGDPDLEFGPELGLGPNPSGPSPTSGKDGTRLSLGGLSVTHLDRRASLGLSGAGAWAGGAPSEAATRALLGTILTEGGGDGAEAAGAGGGLRLLGGRCDVGAGGALLMPGSSLLRAAPGGEGRGSGGGGGGGGYLLADPDGSFVGGGGGGGDDGGDGGGDDEIAHLGDDDDDDGDGLALAGEGVDAVSRQQKRQGPGESPRRVQFAPPPRRRRDPWAMLDPHDAGPGSGARPLRIGVTYRLPPGIEDTPSECVTGASTTQRGTGAAARRRQRQLLQRRRRGNGGVGEGIDSYVSVATYRAARGRAGTALGPGLDLLPGEGSAGGAAGDAPGRLEALADVASVSLNGLAFGAEFAYVAKATARREAAARREERKRRQQAEADGRRLLSSSGAVFDDDDDDDGNLGGGFDFGGGDNDDDDGSVGDGNDAGPAKSNVGVTSLEEAIAGATMPGSELAYSDGEWNQPWRCRLPCPLVFDPLRHHVSTAIAVSAQRHALPLPPSTPLSQIWPAPMPRRSRPFVGRTFGRSPGGQRSTQQRLISVAASGTGRAGWLPSSKRRNRGLNSTFTSTETESWTPSRRRSRARRSATPGASYPLQVNRLQLMLWTSLP
jgi:hypothetical protein